MYIDLCYVLVVPLSFLFTDFVGQLGLYTCCYKDSLWSILKCNDV